jgi:hypothetical protein
MKILYEYHSSRKKQARIFINMSVMFMLYLAGVWYAENYHDGALPVDMIEMLYQGFIAGFMLCASIAMWHIRFPADYDLTISETHFSVDYPKSTSLSFKIDLSEIVAFESRYYGSQQKMSDVGLRLTDGSFQVISLNYYNSASFKKIFNPIGDMYKAVVQMNPTVRKLGEKA